MTLGPLEYVVIAFEGDRFDGSILEALRAAHERKIVRLVDLLFVRKDAAGVSTVAELSDLEAGEAPEMEGFARESLGLLTDEDVERVTAELQPGTATAIALLEHVWAVDLREAIVRAGGSLLAGGLVGQETIALLDAELDAARAAA